MDGNPDWNASWTKTLTLDKIEIGRQIDNLDPRYFNGTIDEIRVWDIALSQAEINARMDRKLDGDEDNLIAYYPMNHGQTGQANPGIIRVLV